MNLERQLDYNAKIAKEAVNEYLEDPEMLSDLDSAEFYQAMNRSSVAGWAVGVQLKSSYNAAKKILDTL